MVLTDEQLIQRLRGALQDETGGIDPPPRLLRSIHDELRSSPRTKDWDARSPRRIRPRFRVRPAHLAPAVALLVVVAVVAVFLGVQTRKPVGSAARGGFALVFRAEPTSQVPVVNRAVVARAALLIRRRIAAGVPLG